MSDIGVWRPVRHVSGLGVRRSRKHIMKLPKEVNLTKSTKKVPYWLMCVVAHAQDQSVAWVQLDDTQYDLANYWICERRIKYNTIGVGDTVSFRATVPNQLDELHRCVYHPTGLILTDVVSHFLVDVTVRTDADGEWVAEGRLTFVTDSDLEVAYDDVVSVKYSKKS
jgi:hypothetical protein